MGKRAPTAAAWERCLGGGAWHRQPPDEDAHLSTTAPMSGALVHHDPFTCTAAQRRIAAFLAASLQSATQAKPQ